MSKNRAGFGSKFPTGLGFSNSSVYMNMQSALEHILQDRAKEMVAMDRWTWLTQTGAGQVQYMNCYETYRQQK